MCGYVLVFCDSFSSAVVPWLYAAGALLRLVSRAGCDGGRNLSGCSSTIGLLGFCDVDVEEAARMSVLDDRDRGAKATCLLRRALRKHEWHIDNVLPRVAIAEDDGISEEAQAVQGCFVCTGCASEAQCFYL